MKIASRCGCPDCEAGALTLGRALVTMMDDAVLCGLFGRGVPTVVVCADLAPVVAAACPSWVVVEDRRADAVVLDPSALAPNDDRRRGKRPRLHERREWDRRRPW
ncbi:MAG TPA: hypothetical protein VKA83_25825 [Methylomirabilota bacterium]|nr:hypothetical protein [Methylomirabilota bacterium]